MNLNIKNEYSKLLKVLLAPVEKKYVDQQKQLINILNKYDVEVLMSDKCETAKYQMFTRDPFIVIGNKIVISYMKEEIRRLERNTIEKILNKIDNSKIIFLADDVMIEGGDVIVHNNVIFVGINGKRTNEKGIKFLKTEFGDKYTIIPLSMINPDKYIPWIHLDCLFNPISSDVALIYKDGFDKKSLNILQEKFEKLIYVSDLEQSELATNVLSIGNNTIIMQARHINLINKVESMGFNVETIDKYDTIKEQGFTRCLTCPLERK